MKSFLKDKGATKHAKKIIHFILNQDLSFSLWSLRKKPVKFGTFHILCAFVFLETPFFLNEIQISLDFIRIRVVFYGLYILILL